MVLKLKKLQESGIVVFDRRAIANVLNLQYASTNPVLDRLVKNGILLRLKRDCYVLAERITSTRKISNDLVKPSYISFWTALNDAGITTQSPQILQSATTKRSQIINHSLTPSFEYKRLPQNLFFGYLVDGNNVLRASPEKALLDLLYVQKSGIDIESLNISALCSDKLKCMINPYPLRVRRIAQSLFFQS
jgi:predicted transcriptional regulator of viral defense system